MWQELAGVPHSIRYARAKGIRTRYLEAGPADGEVLLFLHGSGGYLEAYIRNIAAHAEKFRVIALDLLGHGHTDKPDHPYEPHHYAAHIIDFMNELAIDRAHLSGESLGGWVAARLAIDHPQRVRRMVLNTAAGIHFDPVVSDKIHRLSIASVINPTKETVRARLEWLMLDPAFVTEEMVDMRLRVYRQPGFARSMENIMCLHTPEFRIPNLLTEAALATIEAPTLVLWTTHDPGSSVELGRKLAAGIRGSRFVVMENCGHWPQFENAAAFNELQMEFLKGVS
ncbi:MAG: alpha/beta fold hydrolase [Pirellulales bacterium]